MPVLIFDGDCGFCTSAANYIERHSKTRIIARPWQTTELAPYKITRELAQQQVWLVLNGNRFGGHECFCMLLRIQRKPLLSFVGWLFMTRPFGWLAALGYRLVARFRHRLPGGTPACQMPNAKPRI